MYVSFFRFLLFFEIWIDVGKQYVGDETKDFTKEEIIVSKITEFFT